MLATLVRSVTSRYGRFVYVIAWITIPILLLMGSIIGYIPSLTDVSSNSQEDFLPTGAESKEALRLQKEYFPSSGTPGFLIYRREGGLNASDLKSIETDYRWLQKKSKNSPILRDVSTFFDNPGLESAVLSADRSTLLIFFSMKSSDDVNVEELQKEVREIRSKLIASRKDGLQAWLSGPAGVLEDAVSVFQSIDFRITTVSVLLVLVILLAIYRLAIILAILPILSAGLAYLASSNVVAVLADQFGLVVNAQATSIMVVLIFGAGTDYMLFISSRFREQLSAGKTVSDGISAAMMHVGPAILSSAATTILAMLALGLATLRSYQIMGPILAVGMVFAITAGLTFIPAFLSILGKTAYWPSKIKSAPNNLGDVDDDPVNRSLWGRIARIVVKKPAFTAISSVILLMVMATGVLQIRTSYDLLASLPSGTESVEGFRVLEESFSSGTGDPTSVYIVTEGNPLQAFDRIEKLSDELSRIPGVGKVSGPTRPFGKAEGPTPKDYASTISALSNQLRSMLWEGGANPAKALVTAGVFSHGQMRLAAAVATSHTYMSARGNVIRLDVVFEGDPGSTETLKKVQLLRDEAKDFIGQGVNDILVGGQTALQYDTKVATDRDTIVIAPLVLVVIFIILVLLVRAVVAPLYLLGSVLLSFFASLGISVFLFQSVLGHDGVGSGVPIFMFIFLVALGVDYNIYIISRVREESQNLPIRQATVLSVAKTGGVITSAGIILAGTFTAMMTLPLRTLFQLGFVVSFGVLLDTFFVRGVVVPSFVMLLGRWNWWPSQKAMQRTDDASALDSI